MHLPPAAEEYGHADVEQFSGNYQMFMICTILSFHLPALVADRASDLLAGGTAWRQSVPG
jgi:hypothetical protein